MSRCNLDHDYFGADHDTFGCFSAFCAVAHDAHDVLIYSWPVYIAAGNGLRSVYSRVALMELPQWSGSDSNNKRCVMSSVEM